MDSKHVAKISENATFIIENLEVDDSFLNYLYSKSALDQHLMERIKACSTSRDKAYQFKRIIVKRGPRAFQAFVEALLVTEQDDIAEKLSKEEIVPKWNAKKSAKMMESLNITAASLTGDYFVMDEGEVDINIRLSTASQDLVNKVLSDKQRYYQLKSENRGLAIFLNNENYSHGDIRKGGEVDVKHLKTLYTKLGFQLEEWKNLCANDIKKRIQGLSRRQLPGDGLIFTVLSHGDRDTILATDDVELHLENDIISNISRCQSLKDKPKIFFIQACRGGNEARIESDAAVIFEKPGDTNVTVGSEVTCDHRDCFVMQATVPGYRAYRDTKNGSWFVRSLIHAFIEKCHRADIEEITSQIALRMESIALTPDKKTVKQICQKYSYLTKKLYFLPNYPSKGLHVDD